VPGDWTAIDSWLGLDPQASDAEARRLAWPVKVTAYTSDPEECDGAPHLTAINTPARAGVIALSRDLLRCYNPSAPFNWGDRVYLEGVGEFIVEDTMSARHRRRADIWFSDSRRANLWGVQELRLVVLPPDDLLL
jgi:3D (Asp-Asp-Asp) domain-containing protein